MGSSYERWLGPQTKRNAPTTSGAFDGGMPIGMSHWLTSKFDGITGLMALSQMGWTGACSCAAVETECPQKRSASAISFENRFMFNSTFDPLSGSGAWGNFVDMVNTRLMRY